MARGTHDHSVEFLAASTWYGTLERADTLLAAHPGVSAKDIGVAALLGRPTA